MKKIYTHLALCLSVLLGIIGNARAQTTYTFTCSSSPYTWTVPTGVTSVLVDVQGGAGGNNSYEWWYGLPYCIDSPGHGARVQATLSVVPGSVLTIYVGGKGPDGVTGAFTVAGGYNGGGAAHYAPGAGITYNICGGTGGGGSDIRVGGTGLTNRVVVAGGGGGAGGNYCETSWPSPYANYDRGGDGGTTTGQPGWAGGSSGGASAGLGGTPFGGGSGGVLGGYSSGGTGSLGIGGDAGLSTAGGGGGGGYYGGGGSAYAGGGGGSSWTDPTLCSAVTHTSGYNTGCGFVSITVLCTGPSGGAIVGPSSVCAGSTITLTNPSATPGGTWSSSNPAIASVGATTGIVTGGTSGVVTITYSITTTCSTATASTTITVNALPAGGTIMGATPFCSGSSITLTNPTATPGGTWSSSAPAVASIGATTGVVTGGTPGASVITYSVTTTCGTATTTTTVTVLPIPFGGAIVGPGIICPGTSVTLTNPTGTPGGTWSSSNPAVATVGATTGVVTAGATTGSSVTITYIVTSGCGTGVASRTVTVNVSTPPINVPGTVCLGQPITLTDGTTGGTWSSSNPAVGTIDPVTGQLNPLSLGATTIGYSAGGCNTSTPVTVNVAPGPITGPSAVCRFLTVSLSDLTPGGTWSSSVPLAATVSALGTVYGAGPGGSATNIMYTLPDGCAASYYVSVTTPPAPITGPNHMCRGNSVFLSEPVPGGTWTSSLPGVVVSTPSTFSDSVSGISAGAVTLTYTMLSCAPVTFPLTVNPLPAPIAGASAVCTGLSTILTDLVPGGTWSSSDTSIRVDTTGSVTSTHIGASGVITYTLPTGCSASIGVNVSFAPPPIIGVNNICQGADTVLTDADSTHTGIWSTTDLAIAPVVDSSGVVSGLSAGTVNISYTLPSGCFSVLPFTVNPPVPASVSVIDSPSGMICEGNLMAFKAVPVNGGVPTFFWQKFSVPLGGLDSTGVLRYTPTHGDAIMVFMMPHGVCATRDTVGDTFVVNVYPHNVQPQITITTNSPDTISYIGEIITFFSSVTWGGTSPTYQWYRNNATIPGATASSYTTPVYYSDTFYCKVTGNPPCEDTTPAPGYSNQIIIHQYLGVNTLSLSGNQLSLFPNPNSGSFVLSGTLGTMVGKAVRLEIVNMLGQVVYTGQAIPQNGKIYQQIEAGNLAGGSYLLRVNTDNGPEVFHFVVSR